MKIRILRLCQLLILPLLLAAPPAFAKPAKPGDKNLFLPQEIWRVPKGNNFEDDTSEFSNLRKVESRNFALFWAKEFGADPSKEIPLDEILKECERFYGSYTSDLKFVREGKSVVDDNKLLIFILGGKEGTAFGGGADKKVGILWTPKSRADRKPFGALAHELGHSFQYLVHADGAWGFTSAPKGSRGQPIFEMTSQFMLWQVYPEWMTFENYHLVDFMKKTHYAFLHETNQYHSPYVLEYWATRHGADFVGKLWREAKEGEDPVMAYQRITSINQEKFNDEIFDAARRFMTWDLKRVEKVAAKYANQHASRLDGIADGWHRISETRCPQNYGYNGIKLEVPKSGTEVVLEFKGLAGAESYRSVQVDKAGWRYGFVAVKKDGDRVYGETFRDPEGKATFKVPAGTEHLWLVVTGAPKEHWIHITDGKDENDEQWPYQIRLTGTSPDPSVLK